MNKEENQKEALKLKQQGNVFFKQKKYQKAIQKYGQAIVSECLFSSTAPISAYCIQTVLDAIDNCKISKNYLDAQKAVQLDDKNIKAYFLMGQTLVQLAFHSKSKEKIQMAIEKLKKSLRLCPSQGKNQFQQRFIDQIYKAKKTLWHITCEQQKQHKKLLRSYLINIVENDMSIKQTQKDSLNENIQNLIQKKFGKKQQIPRALICSITKAIMKDPICNQHGNSYSKIAYKQQLAKNGKKDPLSSRPLVTNIMYPNINLKKAIQNFLERNPWAYDEPTA